jgi:hypothetical protein
VLVAQLHDQRLEIFSDNAAASADANGGYDART